MRDEGDIPFEVVGDPEDLPEAFFDALAALLLANHEADELRARDERISQEDTRS